ncbi:DNA topoisomerase 1-like [Rhodamnia argentea]|uniref:DNA topoisomerase 1-like n=1 Tax=Rhodamnia argentea TaxID=178133 RepID=A0ABM3HGX0_9MYRT|nr:DNA topoisomerase 1-like [Rhodamnia argentea]
MEAEPCSGRSSVVNKKRKRKRAKSNRNVSDLGMDKESYFPENNSSVNVIISLPSPPDSSSALENSEAQPCNGLNPLPAKRKKKKRKQKRKIQETSTTQGDTGAEVPYNFLQVNDPEVNNDITRSSGVSRQSLEHEKVRPTGETNCHTVKQKRRKEKKKLWKRKKKEAKSKENVSGKSDTLAEIPNNVSQVAELDENILKEFSSTCGKQTDIEKNMCLSEKEEVHGEAHTKETSSHSDEARVSHLSDAKPEQVEERIQATSTTKAPMGIFDFFLSLSTS